jgi:predicted dehydrogenase
MKQVVLNYRTKRMELRDVPLPTARSGTVLVRTECSAVSLGTEGSKVTTASKSLVGMARERPDLVRQARDMLRREGLTLTVRRIWNRLDTPAPIGYSSAGTVVAVGEGVIDVRPGDRVACGGADAPHAEYAVVPRNLVVPIPEAVPFEHAAFATIASIAMQGVRRAELSVGDRVAIIGLGLVGQLAVQIATAGGAKVLGIDVDPAKIALARQLGSTALTAGDPALTAEAARLTDGAGFDAVLITAATSSSEPVREAARLARDRAKVVVVGIVGLDLPFNEFFAKELDVRLSRSYGPGRYDPVYEEAGVDYPIGYVRWTENRNMQAVLELMASQQLRVAPLITHRFDIAEAVRAYDVVTKRREEMVLGVVFQYPSTEAQAPAAAIVRSMTQRGGDVVVGLIGAGSFAKNTILPNLAGRLGVRLRWVATQTSLSADHVARRYGFECRTTDAAEVLTDPEVTCVIIATRHDQHAPLAAAALRAGKAVFVEKPLGITAEEVKEVATAQRDSGGALMVGFNRRFARHAVAARAFMAAGGEPLTMAYRVNAGYLSREHWLHHPVFGGGRVIGEVCHFIDLLQFFVSAEPCHVTATAMANVGRYVDDNVAIVLGFTDGSVGTLLYASNGDVALAKERIELLGGGRAVVLDDFKLAEFYHGGRRRVARLRRQDKGHAAEFAAFLEAVRAGGPPPIPIAETLASMRATFAALESLRAGAPADTAGRR